MSAFETRHSIRWYRVKSARNEDVEALVRFAKAARPTPDAPVAFAVDPAGGPDTSGWDRLVVEAQHVPNVLVAGAVREEDFFTLESTHLSHRVRPELDRTLAESLWRVSASEGLTSWSGWREPFDHSKALLLEYMHILTRGHRLEDTLRNQVDRRLKESRDLELRALRLVATAHALGGTIPVQVIARLLVAEDEDLQRALARLIDEHLIYQDKSGRLLGLHQVRSEALLRLTHRYPPPTAAMTIEHLVRSLDGSELRAMVPSAFAFEVASDNEILSAAADRLRRDPRLSLLCDLVEATGLEDCRRLALKWVRTLEKSGLPKVQWGDAVFLAGSNVDLPDIFSVPIRTVVHEMSAQTPPDTLRKELVDRLNRPFWREVLRVDPNAAELTRALRCLSRLSHTSLPPTALTLLRAKAHILADLPVEEIGEALSAARAVDRGLADGLVECLGGTEYLLRRIEQELPWCRNLSILEGEKGVEVQGTYRYVAPSAQTDPHKEVIRLSETVFSCLPSVEVVQVKPVDAVGSPAEYLHPDLGQKRIPRPNIPDDTAVAWNRLQREIASRAIASGTLTDRQRKVAALVRETYVVLHSVGDRWVLAEPLSKNQISRTLALRDQLAELAPAPVDDAVPELGKPRPMDPPDAAGGALGAIVNNLIPRLFAEQTKLLSVSAFVRASILPLADELRSISKWTFVEEPPFHDLEKLEGTLQAIADVALELSSSDLQGQIAVRAIARRGRRKGRPLNKAAKAVRNTAEQRLGNRLSQLRIVVREAGAEVEIVRRPPLEDQGLTLPADDIGILVQVRDLTHWNNLIPVLVQAKQELIEDTRGFMVAPVLAGKILDQWSGRVVRRYFPTTSEFKSWPGALPFTILASHALPFFRKAVDMLLEASAILGEDRESWNAREVEAAADALESYRAARDQLLSLADVGGGDLILLVADLLDRMAQSVRDQWIALTAGKTPDPEVTTALLTSIRGERGPLSDEIIGCHVALTEWDLDPETAAERYA